MKTLVVILCQTRAAKLTFPGFKKFVLDELGADLALCVQDGPKTIFHDHAKYLWLQKEPKDWLRYLGDYFKDITPDWPKYLYIYYSWFSPFNTCPGSGGIQLLYRRWLFDLIKDLPYDAFIVTRSDYMWLQPHPKLDPNYIWVPEGEDYGGLCDRYFMTGKTYLKIMLAILDSFGNEEFYKMQKAEHPYCNPEKTLYNNLKLYGREQMILRFPLQMYTIRTNEGPASWSFGKWHLPLGYYVKYDQEFKLALDTMRDRRGL